LFSRIEAAFHSFSVSVHSKQFVSQRCNIWSYVF